MATSVETETVAQNGKNKGFVAPKLGLRGSQKAAAVRKAAERQMLVEVGQRLLAEGYKSKVEFAEVARCFVDRPAYQRPLTPFTANEIKAWDLNGMGLMILSKRENGSYAIIDGQRRIDVLTRLAVPSFRAEVFYNLTPREEASLYVLFDSSKPLTAAQRFHGKIGEGDPIYLSVHELVKQHGMGITGLDVPAGSGITSVDGLMNITNWWGLQRLDETLGVIENVWGISDPYNQQREVLLGVAAFLECYHAQIDFQRLYKILKGSPWTAARQAAKSRGASRGYIYGFLAEEIKDRYNRHLSAHRLGHFDLPARGRLKRKH